MQITKPRSESEKMIVWVAHKVKMTDDVESPWTEIDNTMSLV